MFCGRTEGRKEEAITGAKQRTEHKDPRAQSLRASTESQKSDDTDVFEESGLQLGCSRETSADAASGGYVKGGRQQPESETLEVWRALMQVGEMIDAEKKLLGKDILAALPCALLVEAGQQCLASKEEELRLLLASYDFFDKLSPELEEHREALLPSGKKMAERDAVVLAFREAQEVYEEAYEDLEEAVLKTQGKRAQRRGLDLEALRIDVATKRVAAHAASKGMEHALERLTTVSHTFPEIGLHLRAGLPQELLEVWNPSRTLTFFNSYEMLLTDSRHRVYRAIQGEADSVEAQAFAIKEYMLDSEGAMATCMREAALLCKVRCDSACSKLVRRSAPPCSCVKLRERLACDQRERTQNRRVIRASRKW